MYWDQLASAQLSQLSRSIPVILPVAATEQHGPHLPLATDRMIGEHFCQQLDKEMSQDILILPSMAIGCSEHHLDFTGSLSLQHETFLQQAENILSCVLLHGFKKLFILNSHGGNQGIGQVLVEKFGHRHPNCEIIFTSWWKVASEDLLLLSETGPGGVGHAGEFETSLMLCIAPHLVQLARIDEPHNRPTFSWATMDLLRASPVSYFRSMKQMTPNGVFGHPKAATEEKGKAITQLVVQALTKILSEYKEGWKG